MNLINPESTTPSIEGPFDETRVGEEESIRKNGESMVEDEPLEEEEMNPEDAYEIIDMRTYVSGKREFLIKWHETQEEVWEPEEKIDADLVDEFEDNLDHTSDSSQENRFDPEAEGNGFDKGYEAEGILGVTNKTGETLFLIKFKGVDEADLVTAAEANIQCPQEVIKFYEGRIFWSS